MRPEHGGTLELKLERSSGEDVVYAVTLQTPESEWSASARVRVGDGQVTLELEQAPGWLVDRARNVLRALWRAHADAGWPRRITRWRAGPEAS